MKFRKRRKAGAKVKIKPCFCCDFQVKSTRIGARPVFIKPVAGDVISWMDSDGKMQSVTLENPLP